MFLVLLRFSTNKALASQFMDGHKQWIDRGFSDGVFLMAGSIQPGAGGAVVAHGTSAQELEKRVEEDPFVAENVVTAEVIEVSPARCVDQMKFLAE